MDKLHDFTWEKYGWCCCRPHWQRTFGLCLTSHTCFDLTSLSDTTFCLVLAHLQIFKGQMWDVYCEYQDVYWKLSGFSTVYIPCLNLYLLIVCHMPFVCFVGQTKQRKERKWRYLVCKFIKCDASLLVSHYLVTPGSSLPAAASHGWSGWERSSAGKHLPAPGVARVIS